MIDVLLATYNGAPYVREQIDSILAQQGVDFRILARDDGSTDGTQNILRAYAASHPAQFIVIEDGLPSGSTQGNFQRLLAASTSDYAACSDQDDVWLPAKLEQSMTAMRELEAQHGVTKPLLVYTDLRVVNAQLQTVSESLWQQNSLTGAQHPHLAQLLGENVVTGCTMLLNRRLIDLMATMPKAARMHDHWAALLARTLGAMKAVPAATMLYRQHGGNVIGAVAARGLTRKLARLFEEEGRRDRAYQYTLNRTQATALLAQHGNTMQAADAKLIQTYIDLQTMSPLKRLRQIAHYGLWRNGLDRRLTLAIDILRTPARSS